MMSLFPGASCAHSSTPADGAMDGAMEGAVEGVAEGAEPLALPVRASSSTPWLESRLYEEASHCIHRSQRKRYVAECALRPPYYYSAHRYKGKGLGGRNFCFA